MKVIAKIESRRYVCEISHDEIEKFLNLYYNKLKTMEIGQEFDLGKGYDFAEETKEALKKTEEFIKANEKVVSAILGGISLVGRINTKTVKAKKE